MCDDKAKLQTNLTDGDQGLVVKCLYLNIIFKSQSKTPFMQMLRQ